MRIADLAEQLRERQRIKAQTEGGIYADTVTVMAALSDADIVDSYITCSNCGTKEVNPIRLGFLICRATDAEHFFDLLDAEPKQSHAH